MRTPTTVALAAALVLAPAIPAAAFSGNPCPTVASGPCAPVPPTPTPRPPVVKPPLCVSTAWRAAHTGQPKTKPGALCTAIPGVWVPRSWVLVWPGTYLAR